MSSSEWLSEIAFRVRGGPLKACTWALDRLLDARQDRRFGISSAERRSSRELGLRSPEFVEYQAVSYVDMRQLLAQLPIASGDVFLDYGSGMGRAVCLAAVYPFSRVIGVEISPELCRIAGQNIERVRHRLRSPDVQIVQASALEYLPPEDANTFFLFNPFGGTALSRVLENIRTSVSHSQRNIRIIFYGTVSTRRFQLEAATQNWLRLESEIVLKSGAKALLYVRAL